MYPRIMLVCAIVLAFANGAFANTETERQCFAPSEACAVESANDGVLLLAQSCNAPEHYHACASKCSVRHSTCIADGTPSGSCNMSFDTCTNRCLRQHC